MLHFVSRYQKRYQYRFSFISWSYLITENTPNESCFVAVILGLATSIVHKLCILILSITDTMILPSAVLLSVLEKNFVVGRTSLDIRCPLHQGGGINKLRFYCSIHVTLIYLPVVPHGESDETKSSKTKKDASMSWIHAASKVAKSVVHIIAWQV